MWKRLTPALALGLAISTPAWADQADQYGYGWNPQTLYAQCQDGFYGACLRYDQITGSATARSVPGDSQLADNPGIDAPTAPLIGGPPPAIGAWGNDDLK